MDALDTKPRRCPSCRSANLEPASYERAFKPHGKTVSVELLTSQCPACGAQATSAGQHVENLARLKARKAKYGELLLGEEIQALRRRYGITQNQAAQIFGKGKIAFSRYENESSYPDASTTKLLRLAIERPEVMKALAEVAGVELPLWRQRVEDEQRAKLHWIDNARPFAASPSVAREQVFVMSGNDARFDATRPAAA